MLVLGLLCSSNTALCNIVINLLWGIMHGGNKQFYKHGAGYII